MTQEQYIINRVPRASTGDSVLRPHRKANIVELGKFFRNILEACSRLGVSRQHYYDIKGTLKEENFNF